MNQEIYSNLLTFLIRKNPGESRMIINLIAIVTEARLRAAESNAMEIEAISDGFKNLSFSNSSEVVTFMFNSLSNPDFIKANLDNIAFKNDLKNAEIFIQEFNKRFGSNFTVLPVAKLEDQENEAEPTESKTLPPAVTNTVIEPVAPLFKSTTVETTTDPTLTDNFDPENGSNDQEDEDSEDSNEDSSKEEPNVEPPVVKKEQPSITATPVMKTYNNNNYKNNKRR